MNVFTVMNVVETLLPLLIQDEPVIEQHIRDMLSILVKEGPVLEADVTAILSVVNKIRGTAAKAIAGGS